MAKQRPVLPAHANVAGIRSRTRYGGGNEPYTQANFARAIGVSVGTLRQWEQGRRAPTGAARVLLALLDQDPRLVQRLLGTHRSERNAIGAV